METVRKLILTRKPGVDEIDIKAAEEKLQAVFPEQFVQLYHLVNNPEIGEWLLFPIKDRKNVKKTWDDIVRQNTEVRYIGMADEWIVIGENGTGDKLCLKKVNGLMREQIFLWYHESGEAEELAPSLKQFIISLTEEE
ncbi:SMI1/KNR4 family protein [Niallia sp. Man26]|uniref:SMI1/KNR4 family protein n=1 Tax=Niallia sp. Man26 TaxID=2912824 RepID=UPI001EDAB366|nr:SMI1/KNR4 family protein [Niallia sp. Man26]UPO90416.1 SMI1/KNR4 family protein [Niallia sp. Man26]